MNTVCTFYSNTDAPANLADTLAATLRNLIEQLSIDTFYVGNKGQFNALAKHTLCQLAKEYPHIRCHIFSLPLPSAILNRRMLDRADYLITYIRDSDEGTAEFMALAHRKDKIIFPL